MIEVQTTVRNTAGIHCRPSALIVKAVGDFSGDLRIINPEGRTADPRSIMDLLALGLHEGHRITIQVEGPGEEAMAERIAELFARHFDFPARTAGEETATLTALS